MPFWSGVSGEEAKRVAAQNAARGRTDNSGGSGACLAWCAVMAATTTGVVAVAVVAVRQAARS